MPDLDTSTKRHLLVKSVYDKLLDGEDAPSMAQSTVHNGTDEQAAKPRKFVAAASMI